jgi:8-amino-3,8-dideoxy-alpha-D-manno-octulosonate transaminase
MGGAELIGKKEIQAVAETMKRGVLFRYGFDERRKGIFKTEEFEKAFCEYMRCKYALAVSSGTAALKVALVSCGIGRGDEVIVPAFTFVATVEAVMEVGAKPVLVDIDSSLNINPNDISKRLTRKSKAIIPVHMLGAPARMDEITEIARNKNLIVIEDNAQACGGSYKGKRLGTIGDIGIFSFDFVKMITTGEGGMVVTKNTELYKKANASHDHGHMHKKNIPRGLDTRLNTGFNFRMSEIESTLGLVQLSKLDYMIKEQRQNKQRIVELIDKTDHLVLRDIVDVRGEIASFLVIYLSSVKKAKIFRKIMISNGVGLATLNYWHYLANIKAAGESTQHFKGSEYFLNRYVAFPLSVKMQKSQMEKTASAINRALAAI